MSDRPKGIPAHRWNVQPLRHLKGVAGTAHYVCPNGHYWLTVLDSPPLVNIKCPTCSETAILAVPEREETHGGE